MKLDVALWNWPWICFDEDLYTEAAEKLWTLLTIWLQICKEIPSKV